MLAVALSLLLLPAMLSLAAPAVKEKLEAGRDRLEQLRIELSLSKLGEDFEDTLKQAAKGVPEPDPAKADATGPDDATTARILARIFETRVLTAGLITRAVDAPITGTVQAVRRARARSEILVATERAFTGRAAGQVKGMRQAAAAEAEAARLLERSALDHGVATRGGEFAERRFLQLAHEQPALFARARRMAGEYVRSFGIPATAQSLRGLMLSQLIGHAARGLPVDHRLAGFAVGEIATITGDAANNLMEAQLRRFVVEVGRAPNLEAALATIEADGMPLVPERTRAAFRQTADRLLDDGAIHRAAALNPPHVERLPEAHVNLTGAQDTIQRYADEIYRGQPPRQVADALASFADYIPGSDGADTRTARYRALARLNTVEAIPASVAPSNRASFERARSFRGLRGFARIGGVLIGRLPEDPSTILPVAGFSFALQGDRLFLDLQPAGAPPLRLGPFSPRIAQVALAYAADGRPTTVTMVKAPPLLELRILLHPALVDTPMGCRLTRLDQFADEFSGAVPELKEVREKVTREALDLMTLYEFAWAARAEAFLAADSATRGGLPPELAAQLEAAAESRLADPQNQEAVARVIAGPVDLTPLAAKRDFVDDRLLAGMGRCTGLSEPSTFASCIATDAARAALDAVGADLWSAPPPEFDVWSGVRERGYGLDRDLAFLRPDPADATDPLEFVVQIAFKSAPYFAKEAIPWYTEEAELAAEGYVDASPWELAAVGDMVSTTIRSTLRTAGGEHAAIMTDVREFVVLQGLFRLMLDGRFGDSFPIEQLTRLADGIAEAARPGTCTFRWLVRTGQLEAVLLDRLTEVMESDTLGPPMRDTVAQCHAWLSDLAAEGPLALASAPAQA